MSDTESDRDVDRDDMVNPDETDDDMQEDEDEGALPLVGEE
jgi:hypothetical protein